MRPLGSEEFLSGILPRYTLACQQKIGGKKGAGGILGNWVLRRFLNRLDSRRGSEINLLKRPTKGRRVRKKKPQGVVAKISIMLNH